MEYSVERSDVPGAEARARSGTAVGTLIGSVNFWHARARRAERELRGRRLVAFALGAWTMLAVELLFRWW